MVLVRTTVQHEVEAAALAQRLAESQLAVCVHVLPLSSTYRWQGRIETEPEWLVEARALPKMVSEVEAALRAGHPYDVPLIETIQTQVSPAYGAWARGKS